MSMSDVAEREERPAYVRFEARPVTDKKASLEAGRNVSKDQNWALVTPPYSKDCVEQKVDTWFNNLEFNAKNGRIPNAWVKMYRDQYEAWQEGQEVPVNGTSVKNWAILSPAQVQNLLSAGCKTVEDLALANDEALRRLGMGAMELRNKAQAFLKASNDHGSVVEENAALKTQLSQLNGTIESMQQQINIMVSQGARQVEAPVVETITVADIIEEPQAIASTVVAPAAKFGQKTVQDPELVKDYLAKFGKKPHHMKKDDTIRKELKE